MAEQTIPANLTGTEIMHHVLLWCYNWTQEDFKKAFENSSIGWDYHWNKLQRKCQMGNDSTAAIVNVVLDMDSKHQQMLFNYIFSKNAAVIQSAREWNTVISEQE